MASVFPTSPLPSYTPSLVSLSPCGNYIALLPTPSRLTVYSLTPTFALLRRFSATDYIDKIDWAPEGFSSTATQRGDDVNEPVAMGLILLTLLKRSCMQVRQSTFTKPIWR